uniref:BTB/POZ domain-containing protein n=1 Tax=Salarias fasciatus TaxID=181472 RepID=A0A672G2M8_SALFA
MKPDGVATAALEPMEGLESDAVNEAAPAAGQEPNQAASPAEEEAKETPAAKTGSKTSGDPKAKTANKPTAKTKPGSAKTTPGSKTGTPQSRLSNGVSKPQTNGVARKTATTPADKKSTTTPAPSKKPAGTTGAAAAKSAAAKVGEKKATGGATNGPKPATGTAAAKKTTSTAANGVKSGAAAAAAAKKPLGCVICCPFVFLDVTKPAARKPADSPLTRPSSTTKSAKPETPKSASKAEATAKKPPSKPADTKTPNRSKPQESKATPAKTPVSKAKTSSPKKTVGSSTPTPVKRGPKAAAAAEPEKEIAAAVAAAAAIATAAAVMAGPEEPEPVETPAPAVEAAPEPVLPAVREPSPEPPREPTPEPVRVPTPEPVREPTPEPVREMSPEPVREPTPEPVREPTPEPVREPTPEPVREMSPEPVVAVPPQPSAEPEQEPEPVHEAPHLQMSAHMDPLKFETSVPSLGTTVMSPPSSPPGLASPVREPESASSLLDMHAQPDLWDQNQVVAPSDPFTETREEEEQEEEEEEEEEEENLLMPTCTAPVAFDVMAQPNLMGSSPREEFSPRGLISPSDKEEAVEKADQEINEDDDEEEDDEDEEQRRLGHQPSSVITDMSTSQPSEELQARSSAFSGSAGWHGDDFLSGMDSEDVSSCTSSRQQGVSDLSSTQHTAILEGTQSSDALVDTSLRGSDGDGNFMGSPNVETLANEEEEDEDDERVDDMDLSSERVEEPHKAYQDQEEEDEDVEMQSEGVTESCGNADEDDFNEEERLDNLNRSGAAPAVPPASSWGQSNPFADPWAQPASLLCASSPSPLSDHGAAESETPTQSPAQACLDSGAPSFAPQSEQDPQDRRSSHEQMKDPASDEGHGLLAAPAVGMSQSSTLSGAALAAHSGSETSTPEDLRDYDSSSGVESRSDKQQTPVPASVQPDMEQDLGIHLEKGDGEEEEAETLPADEVLGTGPPTAPASVPSSPSSSGDEASDTEGEMQINDPDAPMTMDESAGFESPPPAHNLPALEEDEEAGDAPAGEGEEDGGGATPQSANSVASYGFDCTTSNSNAHSMAESCGKSPGIFSLENEEQLPDEAKDPSLIKELTLPPAAATAHADDLLGRPVDLMPLGHPGDKHLDDQHYLLGGKMAAEDDEDEDPLEPRQEQQDASDSQPPYYSISDKTDSFLAGNTGDEDRRWQTRSQQDNQNQNQPIANGHYLALVPGNRRPIDPSLAAHFARMAAAPPPPAPPTGEQLRRLEQHQEKLQELQQQQQRLEQERQKRQWLEEERLRLEQQKQLEQQRRELLQLQLQQQQQEHRHRRQVLQWQLELEQQYRMQQKHMQQQQQLRRSPTGVMVSPSSGLCTIYEAMETSDEEDDCRAERNRNAAAARGAPSSQVALQDFQRQLRPLPPQDLDWNRKVDMVQQLINQTLMLSGDGGCPPLLLLPVGAGGTLSPLETSMWPSLLPQFSPPAAAATVTSVSSYSPDSRGSSPPGDWTVVEVETQH